MSPDYRLSHALRALEAGASEKNEATLRGDLVEALNQFLESKKLRQQGVHIASEYRLVRGIPDARVGAIVFEVKLPQPRGAGIEEAINQCRRYVLEFPQSHSGKPARGVAYDGREMALVAENGSIFHRGSAPATARRLEAWLVSLAGAAVLPEDFVDRLGPTSEVAGQMLGELWEIFQRFRESVGIIDEAFQVWRGLYGTATNVSDEARRNLRRTAASLGIAVNDSQRDIEPYLFIIETYLSLLLRLLLARAAVQTRLTPYGGVNELLRQAVRPAFALREMEHHIPGVVGVFEEDVFLWPVEAAAHSSAAEASLSSALLDIATAVDEVDLIGASQDFLRLVYQHFFDPMSRRALGEFYTQPDLVDETLDAVGYAGSIDKRLADITCGSGTFLMRAIERVRSKATAQPVSLPTLTQNIIGVDIHPFAVAMARVNYILAIADLISPQAPVHIPIYWADSLLRLTPILTRAPGTRSGRARGAISAPGARPVVKIAIAGLGSFVLPDHRDVDWGGLLHRMSQTLSLFRPPISVEAVMARFWEGMSDDRYLAYEDTINGFITQIAERHNHNRDMRWLPLLRNALSVDGLRQSCEFIVGNPPWVRIHNIAPEIRNRLFGEYEVCIDAGWRRGAALGGIGRGFGRQVDYSIAFVERAREFLKPGGKLGFVITSKVIHALYGNAMRKSLLRDTKLIALHDYSLHARSLFEDATNYPLILASEESHPTSEHQVKVRVAGPAGDVRSWASPQLNLPILSSTLEKGATGKMDLAEQADEAPWSLVPPAVMEAFRRMQTTSQSLSDGSPTPRKLLGEIPGYQPRRGVLTENNDVFIVKRVEPTENSDEVIVYTEGYYNRRLPDERRQGFRARIEKELLRPLIRGGNVHAWRYEIKDYLIWTHDDATGEPRRELPPRACEYFTRHETALRSRSDYRDNMPAWQIFRASQEKLGNKVVWQELSNHLETTYVPPRVNDTSETEQLLVPLQTAYLIAVRSHETGLILSGLLNSSPTRAYTSSFAERARGGYFRYFSWVLGLLPVPEPLHEFFTQPDSAISPEPEQLLDLSRRLHQSPPDRERRDLEQALDGVVAQLYGLEDHHIEAIDHYLNFIRIAAASPIVDGEGEEED